jgi:hypothetical protein
LDNVLECASPRSLTELATGAEGGRLLPLHSRLLAEDAGHRRLLDATAGAKGELKREEASAEGAFEFLQFLAEHDALPSGRTTILSSSGDRLEREVGKSSAGTFPEAGTGPLLAERIDSGKW